MMALRLGSPFTSDGRGGRARSYQTISASPFLPFGSDSRRFHSTPQQSSWFWPSKGGERLPPSSSDAPLLQDSDQTHSEGTFLDAERNVAEQLSDTTQGSLKALNQEALESAPTAAGWGVWKALAPVSGAIVVALDGVHSVTGLPWWSTIIVSTLLMRSVLLPLVAVQIRKTAQIGSLFSQVLKLGGPETPFLTQVQRFAAARQATKCPNPAWFLAVPAVQIPIFVSSMLALRQMTAEGHPGFDTGGMLWFTDLTLPAGLGLEAAIFPVAIVSLYLSNVQLAFGGIGPRSRFLKVYKFALQALAVPAFVGSFYLPQGLLLYWVTNNCCSLGQNLAVRSTAVRAALGLPPLPDRKPSGTEPEAVPVTDEMIAKMDVNELVQIAATCQAQRRPEEAIKFLKKALARSPEEASIFYALGKTHVGLRKWEEAAEYHGQAAGYAQDDELRGKALYGLGIAAFNQGKVPEAVAALREAAALRPDDLEGQLSLASVLSRNGDKAAALEVVRKAARLEPKLQKYIEELEEELRTQADAANAAEGRR
ncbi:hypothetical protein KFL_003170020 [Klebsormidium nitens]|uniref:Membrane insertase YidC/Oxa/ALB C-terminal domain-containing protein n=1 Tax=Klebsormidium nitens TaxID=105231 RepID=A0A1Y1I7C7_KLENI|nr:hypothetical protein KFL_003170020 [Klebsormidium nitens]|eukprot:GAQ86864.1 hypothetical protein KFL_003170020 [Klebsormidium nitens]